MHQYSSKTEQSSINVIPGGVQTQSKNEEAWLYAINTSETVRKLHTSSTQKNNLQQIHIYHEQKTKHISNSKEQPIT